MRKLLGGAMLLAACVAVGGATGAQAFQRRDPGSGGAPLARGQLTSIHWEQAALREALDRLSKATGAVLFLDRRIDPSLRVSVDIQNADADQISEQVSAAASLGVTRVGSVYYFGPRPATERFRTLAALRADEAAALAPALRRPLSRREPLAWPRLSKPRDLVARVIESRGWRLTSSEQIPHDLWPAGSLPAQSMAEQLTVLLAGFDLTFQLLPAERIVEIMPIEDPVAILRRHALGPRTTAAAARALVAELLPDAQFRLERGSLEAELRIEEHDRLAELLQGAGMSAAAAGSVATRPRATGPGARGPGAAQRGSSPTVPQTLYTLRVAEQPVGEILRQLADRIGVAMVFDEAAIRAAGLSLDRRVSFSVENVDTDGLLRAVMEPAGLSYRREGNRVVVGPGRMRD